VNGNLERKRGKKKGCRRNKLLRRTVARPVGQGKTRLAGGRNRLRRGDVTRALIEKRDKGAGVTSRRQRNQSQRQKREQKMSAAGSKRPGKTSPRPQNKRDRSREREGRKPHAPGYTDINQKKTTRPGEIPENWARGRNTAKTKRKL